MPLNHAIVGKVSPPLLHPVTWRDTVLYALGVGARQAELDFVFEMNGPKVLPTFAVVPSFPAMLRVLGELGADLLKVLHGEQKVIQHRPIPSAGTLSTVAEVSALYDKQKGALAVVETRTSDEKGEPIFDNVFSIFVRGEGGFGGDRGPEAVKADPPEGRAPDFAMVEATSPDQAILYRLSGDLNPLHISPPFAKMAGFDRPILHGLCTYGFAGRALLQHACAGDPARFRSFAARFTGVVFPGDTLTTEGWQVSPGSYVLRTTTQDGRTVLGNAVAEVAQG